MKKHTTDHASVDESLMDLFDRVRIVQNNQLDPVKFCEIQTVREENDSVSTAAIKAVPKEVLDSKLVVGVTVWEPDATPDPFTPRIRVFTDVSVGHTMVCRGQPTPVWMMPQ